MSILVEFFSEPGETATVVSDCSASTTSHGDFPYADFHEDDDGSTRITSDAVVCLAVD